MKSTTLWLHSHFNLIELLRQEDWGGELHIIGSYYSRKYPEALLADEFHIEPQFDSKEQYVEWALNFVSTHRIEVFVVGRKMSTIADAEERFKALGCTLISACNGETHRLLSNKVHTYDALADCKVPLPAYLPAQSPSQFAESLETMANSHPIACFKPAVGIFGSGFRIIGTQDNADLLASVPRDLIVTTGQALDYVGDKETFQEQIVMEYLPGQETSVDCLAQEGGCLRTVIRRKREDGSRVLCKDARISRYATLLTQKFRLTNLFNVQFRERADGSPVLLEVNSRMSGGTNLSCMSGLVLPYWGIKLALGRCEEADIPYAKARVRVAELRRAVVLP